MSRTDEQKDVKRHPLIFGKQTEIENRISALEKRFEDKFRAESPNRFGFNCKSFQITMSPYSFIVNGLYKNNSVFIEYSNGEHGDFYSIDAYGEDEMFQLLYEDILRSDKDYPLNYFLCKSKNYYLEGHFETVCLCSVTNQKEITDVGDFYGDCSDGIIDVNERFCVTVGCGYIIYYLTEPFAPYEYNKVTDQWKEGFRDGESERWFESVSQINDNQVELVDEYGVKETLTID